MESETKNSENLTLALADLIRVREFVFESAEREEARRIYDALGLMKAKMSERFGFAYKAKTFSNSQRV